MTRRPPHIALLTPVTDGMKPFTADALYPWEQPTPPKPRFTGTYNVVYRCDGFVIKQGFTSLSAAEDFSKMFGAVKTMVAEVWV